MVNKIEKWSMKMVKMVNKNNKKWSIKIKVNKNGKLVNKTWPIKMKNGQ